MASLEGKLPLMEVSFYPRFEWRVPDAYTEYGGLHRTNLYID